MLATVFFAILAAVTTGIRYYIDRRISDLSSQAQKIDADVKDKAQIEREQALKQKLEESLHKQQELSSKVSKAEEKAKGRHLSDQQREMLVSILKGLPHSPTPKVVFDSVVGSPEAKKYGGQLTKALSDSIGVHIDEPLGLSTCLECIGVWVAVNENATEETHKYGKAISEAFNRAGVIGAKFATDPRNGQGTPTTVKVIVGPKE